MKRHDKGLACHGHAAMGNMPWTGMTVTPCTWSPLFSPIVCLIFHFFIPNFNNNPILLENPIFLSPISIISSSVKLCLGVHLRLS